MDPAISRRRSDASAGNELSVVLLVPYYDIVHCTSLLTADCQKISDSLEQESGARIVVRRSYEGEEFAVEMCGENASIRRAVEKIANVNTSTDTPTKSCIKLDIPTAMLISMFAGDSSRLVEKIKNSTGAQAVSYHDSSQQNENGFVTIVGFIYELCSSAVLIATQMADFRRQESHRLHEKTNDLSPVLKTVISTSQGRPPTLEHQHQNFPQYPSWQGNVSSFGQTLHLAPPLSSSSSSPGFFKRRPPVVFKRATFGGLGDVEGVLQRADPFMADRTLDNAGELAGKIVIVGRGLVPFVEKARRVEGAGGVGMVVVNSSDDLFVCTGKGEDVRVPVVCVAQQDGAQLVDGARVCLRGVQCGTGTVCFDGGLTGDGRSNEFQHISLSHVAVGDYIHPKRGDDAVSELASATTTPGSILPTLTPADVQLSSNVLKHGQGKTNFKVPPRQDIAASCGIGQPKKRKWESLMFSNKRVVKQTKGELPKMSVSKRSPVTGGRYSDFAISTEVQSPCYSMDQLNDMVLTLRLDVARRNKYVSLAVIVNSLMTLVGVTKIQDLGIHSIVELRSLKELAAMEDYVKCFITCFITKQRICTLHELEAALVKSKGKDSYEQLLLGPLLQHPVIIREFRPPAHLTTIPAVTTMECVDAIFYLRLHLRKGRIYPFQIVEYLARVRGVPALNLCVKIGCLDQYRALLMSIADLQTELTTAKRRIASEIKLTEIKSRIEFDLLERSNEGPAKGSAEAEMIKQSRMGNSEWSQKAEDPKTRYTENNSFQPTNAGEMDRRECSSSRSRRWRKGTSRDRSRLRSLSRQRSGSRQRRLSRRRSRSRSRSRSREWRHLASLRRRRRMSKASPTRSWDEGARPKKDQPPDTAACNKPLHCRATVVDAIAGQLRQRCSAVASAAELVNLQHDTAKELGATSFDALGFGDFLSFMWEEPCLSRLLNGWIGLGGGCPELEVVAAHARRALQGLQAGAIESEAEAVMTAVRLHLRLARFGTAAWQERTVRAWEAAAHLEGSSICGSSPPSSEPPASQMIPCAALLTGCVGLDGGCAHLLEGCGGVAAALQLLKSAPLLEDLATWTHWDVAFEAHLGGLRPFLAAHQEAGLACLDAGPHGLLRVSTTATPAAFQAMLAAGDAAGAAAELVSIVCLHDGVLKSPLSLLEYSAAAGFGQFALRSGDEMLTAALAVTTIAAVPEALRAALIDRTVVGPLGSALAVGRARCCALMWDASHDSKRLRWALQQLGIRLSISAWTSEWAARLLPQEEQPSPCCPAAECPSKIVPVLDLAEDNEGLKLEEERQASVQPDPVTFRADLQLGGCETGAIAEQKTDCGAKLDSEVVEARRVVEEVRMTEFGVGLALDANGAGLREALNARVGRALQRLSADLYASDGHFLLELVQNADDNSYPPSVVPELLIVRGADVILVANNERGFGEADVRALCDVGRSTKARQVGFIGQKGIGFKSVFRVTDAPQIHSKGYSIAFDTARNGDLGYILPEWVGSEALVRALQESRSADSEPLLDPRIWATIIVLPIREAARGGIGGMLDVLSPTLLLFLKRLRRLSVFDVPGGCRRVFHRRDLGRGMVEISAGDDAVCYLTATRSIRPAVPRLDVMMDRTDIVIAIPLPTPGIAALTGHGLQEVFAFLPVRSYGFRFVLQADFVLPSSREAIDRDSPWNQRLRAEVPAAFALAVEQAMRTADPADPVAIANLWLAVLPLETEVLDFFQPCVRAVHATMRTVACIPTVEGKWECPVRLLTCSAASAAVSALVDPAQLSSVLGMSRAHAGLLQRPLAALGIKEVSAGTVLDLLRGGAYSPEQLPAVVGCVAEDFSRGRLGDDNQALLAGLPLLLLDNGAVTNVNEGHVYLPLSASGPMDAAVSAALTAAALKLSGFVRVLHPAMLGGQTSKSGATFTGGPRGDCGSGGDVLRLLRFIGLESLTLECLVNRHVLPELTGPAKLELSQDRAVALLAVVCYYWSTLDPLSAGRSALLSALRGNAVLWTSTGPVVVGVGAGVHFSRKFGSAVKSPLLEWLEASGWVFLSCSYLALSTIGCKEWREFLLLVGVRDFVEVCPRALCLTDQDLAGDDGISYEHDLERRQDVCNGRVFDDWYSPEVENVLSSLPSAVNKRQLALCAAIYLEEHWADQGYAEKLIASLRGAVSSEGVSILSSFARTLRNASWLPAQKSPNLAKPAALWARSDAVLQLFGPIDIPYIDPALGSCGGRFVRDLGVQVRPTVRGVLHELVRWSRDTTFEALTADMCRIYAYLSSEIVAARRPLSPQFDASAGFALERRSCLPGTSAPSDAQNEIRLAFHSQPLVFFPLKARGYLNGRKGSFCSLAMLRLRDPTGVVEELEGSALRIVTQHYTKEAGFDPERHVESCSLCLF